MVLLRAFWDAAGALDPAARQLDEGMAARPCDPARLAELWAGAGLQEITPAVLVPSVRYADFDELWQPLSAGAGPAGAYAAALDPARRAALRDELHRRLGRAGRTVRAHRPGVGRHRHRADVRHDPA